MSYFSVDRRFHCIWLQRLISNLFDRNVHFRRLISNVDQNFPNSKKVGPTMFDVAAQDSESLGEQNPKNKFDKIICAKS
jgi:hypothetical protein